MDNYETLHKIGDGTFGSVYLCRKRKLDANFAEASKSNASNSSDTLVAIKKMKRRYYDWNECMRLREVSALKSLNHPNVILLKEVIRENNNLYLVFDYMEQNLYQLIRTQNGPFQEVVIRGIVAQIAKGLNYIHSKGFFHRDIKPENLLCRDGGKVVKIADFGLIREIDSKPPFTEYVSTRWYRAPELLLHSTDYNWSVDIWALGCVTSELYMLRPLFAGKSEIEQIFKMCQILGPPNITTWPEGQRLASLYQLKFPNIVQLDLINMITDCAADGHDLIESLLKWNPSDRLKTVDVLNHHYLKTDLASI